MKKGKKILFAVIMGMLSITLISCGGAKPKKLLEDTFTQIKGNVNDVNIKYFELGTQREGLGQTSEFLDSEAKELINKAFSQLQFKINSEHVDGNTATFNVSVVGPNISLVLSNTSVKRTMSLNSTTVNEDGTEVQVDMSDSNLNDILRKALIESFEGIKTDDRTETITLTKVEGQWQIEENDEFVQLILGKSN